MGIFEKDLPYKGAYAEFGIAIGKGIPCYILGTAADGCVFMHLSSVKRGLEELL